MLNSATFLRNMHAQDIDNLQDEIIAAIDALDNLIAFDDSEDFKDIADIVIGNRPHVDDESSGLDNWNIFDRVFGSSHSM